MDLNTIKNKIGVLNNDLTTTNEDITFNTLYAATDLYTVDKQNLYNFSSTFNWHESNPGKYITSITAGSNKI